MNSVASQDSWILDSAASNHMSGSKTLFKELNENHSEKIYTAGQNVITSAGIGKIFFKVQNDEGELINIALNEVLYVQKLRENLLSVKSLTNNDNTVIFEGNTCKIQKNGEVIVTAFSDGNLFVLKTVNNKSLYLQNF